MDCSVFISLSLFQVVAPTVVCLLIEDYSVWGFFVFGGF